MDDDREWTVAEFIAELSKFPPDMLVKQPDPGCGCCASGELWDLSAPVSQINAEDNTVVVVIS